MGFHERHRFHLPPPSCIHLRLVEKAKTCAKELDNLQETVSELNSQGILSGYTAQHHVRK